MERSAQRPRLDEAASFPELVPDVLLGDPVHACSELELGGSLNLGVHPAEIVHDVDEAVGVCPLGQAAAGQPPGTNVVPCD
jgi:hypothetical protein